MTQNEMASCTLALTLTDGKSSDGGGHDRPNEKSARSARRALRSASPTMTAHPVRPFV